MENSFNEPAFQGLLPTTPIIFDNFLPMYKNRVCFYILTHFHADHYIGLQDNWNDGIIYCSILTRRFILQKWNINPSIVIGLQYNKIHTIPFIYNDKYCKEYCTMELFDANHCPGSAMFLIKGYFGNYFLTGDFRLSKSMYYKLCKRNLQNENIDYLIMDCTFSDKFWKLPTQSDAIKQIITIIDNNPNSNIYIECEMLGLEPIILYIAKKYNTKIHVDKKKWEQSQVLPRLLDYLTLNENDSRFHICPYKTFSSLQLLNQYSRKLNFNEKSRDATTKPNTLLKSNNIFIKPSTMWFGKSRNAILNLLSFQNKPAKAKDALHVLYSIHSSYEELLEFVKLLKPKKILPSTECNSKTFSLMNTFTNSTPLNNITIPYYLIEKYPSLKRQQSERIHIEQNKESIESLQIENLDISSNTSNINTTNNILSCWSISPPQSPNEDIEDCIILEEYNYKSISLVGKKRTREDDNIFQYQQEIKKQKIGW